MAIQFNSTADLCTRGSDTPASPQLFTVTCWAKAHSLGAGALLGLNPSGSLLLLDAQSGGWVYREGGTVQATSGSAPTVDKWYFCALRTNGTTVSLSVGDETTSVSHYGGTLGTLPGTSYQFWVGTQYTGDPDCDIAYVRVWDAWLSDAEVEAERSTASPARTTSICSHWPLADVASMATDTSGNGRDLTPGGGGAWTTVSGPAFYVAATGSATGVATVSAQGSDGTSLAESAGTSTASAGGQALLSAVGSSAGASTVTGHGAQLGVPWDTAQSRLQVGATVYGTGTPGRAVDGGYGYQDDPGSWGCTTNDWVAVYLGSGPDELLVGLSSDQTGGTYAVDAFAAYRLLTSGNSTNGVDGDWTTRVTETTNPLMAREHKITFTGHSWVKLILDDCAATSIDEIDIWDADGGTPNTVALLGDSITDSIARRWTYFGGGGNTPSFQTRVGIRRPGCYPLQLNCGATGQGAAYWATNISSVLSMHADAKYWLVCIGMNDASGMPSGLSSWITNMTTVLNAIKTAGRVPILARVTWTGAAGYGGGDYDTCQIRYLNDNGVDYLVDAVGVLPGPDLYAISYANRVAWAIETDPHMNSEGQRHMMEIWASFLAPTAEYGAAAGTSTVAGIGSSVAAAVGSSAGVSTAVAVAVSQGSTAESAGAGAASAVGATVFSAAASSDGVGAATGVGASTVASAGSSAGVAAGAAVGAAVSGGVGASVGVAAGAGAGASEMAAVGSAAGAATVAGVGAGGGSDAVGSTAGVGEALGAGAALHAGAGAGAGVGVATAEGGALSSAVATSSGVASAAAVSSSGGAGMGASAGVGVATGAGASTVSAVGAAAGTGVVAGVGAGTSAGEGVASSDGVGAASAVGASTAQTAGAAAGEAASTAAGASLSPAVGSAAGAGTASAVGGTEGVWSGASTGTSVAAGAGASVAATSGGAVGVATVVAVGASTWSAVAVAAGASTATATASGAAAGDGASSGTSAAAAVGRGWDGSYVSPGGHLEPWWEEVSYVP